MAGSELAAPPAPLAKGQLGTRLVVGAVLAAIALASIWAGGIWFTLLVVGVSAVLLHEWSEMHGTSIWRFAFASGLLVTSIRLAMRDQPTFAILFLLASAVLFLLLSLSGKPGRRSMAGGLLYAGLPAVALVWLRGEPDGFALVLWTMGIVWATDSFAYFTGRAIGGRKLWPAVSPSKTWAGLGGGVAAAGLFSAVFGHLTGWAQSPWLLFGLGALLGVVAQAGDFFESWLKRRAGVKDSGTLLPGHGGLMDRVDGLIPVACLVALWVALR
jgi:phosphatidate cytidylyltransferase